MPDQLPAANLDTASQVSLFDDEPPTAEALIPVPEPAPPPAAPATPDLDSLLDGSGRTTRLVAVEIEGGSAVMLRSADGRIERLERPFRPWLLSVERGAVMGARWSELQGAGHRWRADFDTWPLALAAREALREAGISVVWYGSPVKQYLIASGETLFKGMNFPELRRSQLDLETTTLDPEAPDARILMVALGETGGRSEVIAHDDEAELLRRLVAWVREVDPDTIEGHNLLAFDMPYVLARAERLRVPLLLGRDGSPLRLLRERNCPIGGTQRSFRPAQVWGRHCIDTMLATQRFDVGRNALEGYGLKECAQVYGLAEPDRVILERDRMEELWRTDPELVRKYALQDVGETDRLAELVTPTEFYQARMVPDSYQAVATTGTGEKVNALMIRAYLAAGCAVPQQQAPRAYPGGHTEVRRTGVVRRIVKADVESLYPSIMLTDQVCPAADTLGVFLPMLRRLTELRLEAKASMRSAKGSRRDYWNGLQSSFKILINSFYGYLGGPFYFNDYDAAERVTLTGQAIVKQIAERLEQTGSEVIEIDTDGVYFVPPADVADEAAEERYVDRIGAGLPAGIRLAFDGRYQAMLSLKIKNYVLVDYAGRKSFTGGSLRSRADERFGRDFIARAVDHLIEGDPAAVGREYQDLLDRILHGQVPIEQLARRERVTQKTLSSDAKKRTRAAVAELTVGDSLLLYQRADGSLARVEDYAGDEDRLHYAEKLRKFATRLEEAIGADFDRLCPKPSRHRAQAIAVGQTSLFDL